MEDMSADGRKESGHRGRLRLGKEGGLFYKMCPKPYCASFDSPENALNSSGVEHFNAKRRQIEFEVNQRNYYLSKYFAV